jgi:HAD superfamily hydrolase (TIGR01509 family)
MTAGNAHTIEAIVFDMDGILIDSEVIWGRVRKQYANERGLEWTEAGQLSLMGLISSQWSVRMHEMLQLKDVTARELELDIRSKVATAFERDLPVRKGALQAVEGLAAHWPIALASGSPRDLVELAMERTGMRSVFKFMLTGDDVVCGKPDPEIYLRALSMLGVAGNEAVGIEDSANGIRALRSAGMWVVAAPCPEFPLSADVQALAHVAVEGMDQIDARLIAEWGHKRPAATAKGG